MELLKYCVDALQSCNARDIKIYDMQKSNPFYDYAIVATAVADRQINALIGKIQEEALKHNFKIRNCVGRDSSWLLIDLNDVIINFFTYDERLHFDLDKMWINHPLIELK